MVFRSIWSISNGNCDGSRISSVSDLPLAGRLFRRTNVRDEKDELLIFVTPRIMKETLAIR